MAKGGGIKTSKGSGAAAPARSGPTEASTMAHLEELARSPQGRLGMGGLIADLRSRMGGTREQQDSLLQSMSKEGRVVLYKNDHTKSVTPHEIAGGIQLGSAEHALPRTIIYINRRYRGK